MVQVISKVLFVIGATAAGMLGAMGLSLLTILLIFPVGRDSWAASTFFVVLTVSCGVVSAIASLLAALYYVAQNSMPNWSRETWLGVGVGLVSAIVLRMVFGGAENQLGYLLRWLPGQLLTIAASGFLGGVLGHVITGLLKFQQGKIEAEK